MQDFLRTHKNTKWAALIVSAVLVSLLLFLALFDWNALRGPLARAITARTGRPAAIHGDLKVHLWSWNPSAEVDDITLDNPTWADRKIMFGARRITVSVSLGRLLRGQIVLPRVDLIEPTANLERDSRGRASWELGTKAGTPNHNTAPAKLPAIRRLTIEGGKLHVVDLIRKLTFSGSLVAAEQAGKEDASAFEVRCTGSLNEKPFRLEASGGPLLDLEPTKPYSFSVAVTASDIDLKTHVTVRKPFDLGALDIQFQVSGDDLADVYYLTGLALPNTPKYRLGGTVHVDGTRFAVDGLQGSLGSSDLSGRGTIETGGERPKLTASLSSKMLDMADLAPILGEGAPPAEGLSAAPASRSTSTKPPAASNPSQRATPANGDPTVAAAHSTVAAAQSTVAAAQSKLLLPDADLQVKRVQGMDADVTYAAVAVRAPKLPLKDFNLHVMLHDGVLILEPLSLGLEQGKLAGRIQIDARQSVPVTDIDMHIDAINLSEFTSSKMQEAPLDGVVLGRFEFHGSGTSVHKFAASSQGTMSVVIPHGEISDAIAELTGINVLKGLELLVTKEQQKTEIRCGIMDFKDRNGSLDTTTVYIDTSNVLITGRGNINLGSEAIDVALQGDPKQVRLLRLRAPIALGGTLRHPTVGIKAGKLAEQAGAAAALGALLTPVAAAIAFIDPGLAKNKDCSTVLEQARAGVNPNTANLNNSASP
jgi:uncharacterized protein involved in outer membrane biogenesis